MAVGYRSGREIGLQISLPDVMVPISYTCPRCGEQVESEVELVSLVNDQVTIPCPQATCGERNSSLTIYYNMDVAGSYQTSNDVPLVAR